VPLQRLQAFVGLLSQYRPELDAEVRHLPSGSQLEYMHAGELDLGLVHETPSDGLATAPVYQGEPLAAVVSLGHSIAARETARIADLAGDVLLLAMRDAEPGPHARLAQLAASDGMRFRAIREAPGPDVRDLLFAVASGQGVTLAPHSTLRTVGELGNAVTARPIDLDASMPATCLAWPRRGRPELAAVYETAREVARELFDA
jgi:DNA-binding transcriptional LysR family regulator